MKYIPKFQQGTSKKLDKAPISQGWDVPINPMDLSVLLNHASGQSAIDLIKQFEGFRSNKYKDAKGIPTIGYGTTNKQVVNKGKITEEEASKELLKYINENILPTLEKKPYYPDLYPNQKTALTSLIYNIGQTKFNNSKMLQQALNNRDWNSAIKEMNHGETDLKNPGLKTRRLIEKNIFSQTINK